MFALRRLETIPTIALALAFSLFIAMGSWQLYRKAWKEDIMARAKAALEQPALENLPPREDLPAVEYHRITLKGRFLPEQSLYLGGRLRAGDSGYFLLTPMALDDGRYILVNRGFIPQSMRKTFEKFTNNDTQFTVQGIMRMQRKPRPFALQNRPKENIWFREDFAAMSEKTGLNLEPAMIEVTRQSEIDQFPIPSEGRIVLRNDHLGYALTWYALAIVSVAFFLIYHRKKPE